jgi:hypothetical protein
LSVEPLTLRSTVVPGGLRLRLRQQYRLVKSEEAPRSQRWHVSTVAYWYRLDRADGGELLSWHWHPQSSVSYPHAHVDAGPITLVRTGRG